MANEKAVIIQIRKNVRFGDLGPPLSKHQMSREQAEILRSQGYVDIVDVVLMPDAPDLLEAAPVNRQAPVGVKK
jgi:hypothetical protein